MTGSGAGNPSGSSLLAIGLSAIALSPLKGHSVQLVLLTMLSGIGFGLFQVPNNRNMFLSAPGERVPPREACKEQRD